MQFTPGALVLSQSHPVGILAYRADVASLMPHAVSAELAGQRVLVVPHGLDEARLLRNLGIEVADPILYRYDWAGLTPYEAQRQTAAMLTAERAAYVINEFGTGKTRAALFAFDYLHMIGRAKRMLVVAPLSTLEATWLEEIRMCFPHLRAVVAHGERERRELLLDGDFDIYIINHDGVRTFTDKIIGVGCEVVCVDELTAFKTANAARSKAMRRIAETAGFRWGMTGSPTPQGPEDAHGQLLLITPDRVPHSFTRWRDKVMVKMSQFTYLPRPNATEIVYEAMQPAVRFTRDEVVELPPCSVMQRQVAMSELQAKTYNEMLRYLRSQFDAGEVTAANEAVKLNKLLQISSGFVYQNDGWSILLDPQPRIDMIVQTIGEAQAKVLVFCPFIAGVDLLHEALNERFPGRFIRIAGDTPGSARKGLFDQLRHGDALGAVAHPKTMSHGLNLPEVDMTIWAAPYPSLETYEQANARMTRPGQTRKQMIVQIIGSPVEAKVYRRLDQRAGMQSTLLEMFE